jgi:hypothetical protein
MRPDVLPLICAVWEACRIFAATHWNLAVARLILHDFGKKEGLTLKSFCQGWILTGFCAAAVVCLALTGCSYKIENAVPSYSAPYLMDFTFALRDNSDHAVVATPSSFEMTAKEDDNTISPSETAFLLAPAANKQSKCFLVLDYTNSMADPVRNGDANGNGKSDAVEMMETSAKEFIDGMTSDAQVGILEFHREDPAHPPTVVADFTTNKDYLKARIDAIWGDYVQGFPASSRCWDAVQDAIGMFPDDQGADEERYLLFLSDGVDESSTTATPDTIIAAAKDRAINVYCIGFGDELAPDALEQITSKTGGAYYKAGSVEQLGQRFDDIWQDLGGRYTFRWSTLRRDGASFVPSFEIKLNGASGSYTGPAYTPTDHTGDVLRGVLRVPEYTVVDGHASLFIRASYSPRYVTRLSLYVQSPYAFTATLVGADDGGLCQSWADPVVTTNTSGATIALQSKTPADIYTAITYGAFGPILRLDFANLPETPGALVTAVNPDNSLYGNGQSFVVESLP